MKLGQTISLLVLLGFAGVVQADAYDDAKKAHNAHDYPTTLETLQPLAEIGDARAQDLLGTMYRSGSGVPQDYQQAIRWFHKAVEHGNASAQNHLNDMYDEGVDVPKKFVTPYERIGFATYHITGFFKQKFEPGMFNVVLAATSNPSMGILMTCTDSMDAITALFRSGKLVQCRHVREDGKRALSQQMSQDLTQLPMIEALAARDPNFPKEISDQIPMMAAWDRFLKSVDVDSPWYSCVCRK